MPTRPLASTQPQFGKGLMVNAKMVFAIPSIMKKISKSTLKKSTPASVWRSNNTPMTIW